MSTPRQILAAIFDMDGLLIDSEPLWDRAELDVMASLGVDISRRNELPDTLGLRIDMVVDLWYAHQPWVGPGRDDVTARIINRAITLVEEQKPLLPGVRDAIALCKAQGLKVGLASASPLHMLEKCCPCLNCATASMRWPQPRNCPTASRTLRSIWTAPQNWVWIRSPAWRWKIPLTAWWPQSRTHALYRCACRRGRHDPALPWRM